MRGVDSNFEIIDLGCYLDQAAYPPWGYAAKHVDHTAGARAMAGFFNLRGFHGEDESAVTRADFPESLGLAWTHVTLSDHTGNHIDAPYHFGPLCEGRPARTIDEVPLEWCIGPGVRLDFRHLQGRDIEPAHIEQELDRIGARLGVGSIPLIWTGADAVIDQPDAYWQTQAGLSLDGLFYLLDQGVRLIGIDAYAMDVSYQTMQSLTAAGEPQFFPAHFAGRAREHMHLEKLVNLGRIPCHHGFTFVAFPVKIRGASAGWVRPVALVPRA